MIILGIDPGTATTGYGAIRKTKNKVELIDYGCIITSKSKDLSSRLRDIYEDLNKLIKRFKPDIVAVEDLFFFTNLKTAIKVSHARGVVLLAAELKRIPLASYTPLQVKQGVAGYGRADKKQIQKMVKLLLDLKNMPKPDDASDALAVALCHAQAEKCRRMMK